MLTAIILAGVCFPYFIDLGSPSLWDANEAFYAETPREMLESGNWLRPTFNFQTRLKKPPLTYWVVLLSYKAAGISEFAVRLPGALAALGVVLLTFGIGRSLFNTRAATIAAVVVGLTLRTVLLARKLPIDILLLFCLTATAYFLVRAIRADSKGCWILAYFCAGLGFLTKGPVGLAIPFGATLVYLAFNRTSARIRPRLWLGLPILCAIILPWYVLIIHYSGGWSAILPFFLQDNIGRYVSQSYGPTHGPLFYFSVFLGDFFPWSFMVLPAGYVLWRSGGRSNPLRHTAHGFPLAWCLFVFVFFSIAKNKQEYYLAPLYPMAAVVLGAALDQSLQLRKALTAGERSLWVSAFYAIALVILGLAAFLFVLLPAAIPNLSGVLHYASASVALLAAVAVAWFASRADLYRCLLSTGVSVFAASVLFSCAFISAIEPGRPVKEFCGIIGMQLRDGDEAGYFRANVPSMVYYLRHAVFEEYDADAMVRRFLERGRIFCIMTEEDFDYFVGSRDLVLYVLDRRPRLVTNLRVLLGRDDMTRQELLLVSNRPDSETGADERRVTP